MRLNFAKSLKTHVEKMSAFRLAMMCQIQKELAMNSENLEKIYVIETEIVSPSPHGQGREKGGG